jgi:hypothetical protein
LHRTFWKFPPCGKQKCKIYPPGENVVDRNGYTGITRTLGQLFKESGNKIESECMRSLGVNRHCQCACQSL